MERNAQLRAALDHLSRAIAILDGIPLPFVAVRADHARSEVLKALGEDISAPLDDASP